MSLSKQSIIDAAATLFKDKGYSSTSVQDIAEALGVTKAALYYYVSSKEGILCAIFDQTMTTAERRMDSLMSREMSTRERIGQIIFNHIMAVFDEAPYISVFFSERVYLSEPNLAEINARRRRYEERIAAVIRSGISEGSLKPVDVLPMVYGILGMCNWLYHWYEPGGRLSPSDIAELFADVILNGIGNDKG